MSFEEQIIHRYSLFSRLGAIFETSKINPLDIQKIQETQKPDYNQSTHNVMYGIELGGDIGRSPSECVPVSALLITLRDILGTSDLWHEAEYIA